MAGIRIRSCSTQDVTVISNDFLDRFLPGANGDFLKIYLYLLRSAGGQGDSLTLSDIADRMNCTENDVDRALRYWEKEGVLKLTRGGDGSLQELAFADTLQKPPEVKPVAVKASEITSERMAELGSREDMRELLFIAQQYIGHPLTRTEMQKIFFFYDSLHFSPDLIDYLIEYCVSRGHTSFHYIEKVALNWKDQGISTVRDARVEAGSYHREYYDILKALGIDNHHPVEAEIRIMKKWIEKYGFPMDIIREACSRTVMGAGKPTLSYADSILSKWHARGVKTVDDIAALDEEHSREASARRTSAKSHSARPSGAVRKNAFTDFEQREYDYDDLEARLLNGQT